MSRLRGKRVLVVGASAGIGRASARLIAAEGARTAVAARSLDRVKALAAELDTESIPLQCDVRDEASCHRLVEDAARSMGGIDAVVFAPGETILTPLKDAGADSWRDTFATNLFGAAFVTRYALPHLERAPRGRVVYFSSNSIDDRPPRYALAPYVASKVALESMAQAWQGEHPSIGFTTIAMGETATNKSSDAPPEAVAEALPRWQAAGLMAGRFMDPATVAEQVVSVLASEENVRRLAISPFPPRPAQD